MYFNDAFIWKLFSVMHFMINMDIVVYDLWCEYYF